MKETDVDHTGTIKLAEFTEWYVGGLLGVVLDRAHQPPSTFHLLRIHPTPHRTAFARATIDRDRVTRIHHKEDDIEKIFDSIDTHKSNTIDRAELDFYLKSHNVAATPADEEKLMQVSNRVRGCMRGREGEKVRGREGRL